MAPIVTLLLSLLLLSCDRSPTGTDPGRDQPQATTLDRTEITISQIGGIDSVAATSGDRRTHTPDAMTVVQERRYLHDMAVLDSAALASKRIRAHAPGTVVLNVTAFGNAPVQLTVHVKPQRPLVLAVRSEGPATQTSPAVLRGYRMSEITQASIQSDGGEISIVSADSANLRLRSTPADAPEACAGGAPTATLQIQGVDALVPLQVKRERKGDLRLAVGESRRFGASEIECLRLPATPRSAYALVFMDQVLFRNELEGPPQNPPYHEFKVSVADRTSPAAAQSTGLNPGRSFHRSPSPGKPDFYMANTGDHCVYNAWERERKITCYPRALAVGDTLTYTDPTDTTTHRGKVIKVSGRFAFVGDPADTTLSGAVTGKLDEAQRVFEAHTLPLLQRTLTETHPFTSMGSGQLAVIVRPRVCGGAPGCQVGTGKASWDDQGNFGYRTVRSTIYLSSSVLANHPVDYIAGLLAHEFAHAWQTFYKAEVRAGDDLFVPQGTIWQLEGHAALMEIETQRLMHDIPLEGNTPWWERTDRTRRLAVEAINQRGDFMSGYFQSSSFMRDLLVRRIRSGESYEAALREVSRGVLEGLGGKLSYNSSQHATRTVTLTGLTQRMRQRFGPGWDPVDAALTWAASQALDDVTGSEVYQNRTFYKTSQFRTGFTTHEGWQEHATLKAGVGVIGRPVHVNNPTTQQGTGVETTRRVGSLGFFLVEDDGTGGSFEVKNQSGEVVWMVVRYR